MCRNDNDLNDIHEDCDDLVGRDVCDDLDGRDDCDMDYIALPQ